MNSSGLHIRENCLLGEYTTFGVGGPARYFADAASEEEILAALEFAEIRGIPVFVLGGGSNVLISDDGFPGMVILNGIKGYRSRTEGEYAFVYAGAGEDWQQFNDRCILENLQGIECLAGIPGTVGAAPVQNIGAYGQEVSRIIAGVRAIDIETGKSVFFSNEECGFGYRRSIFNSASAGKYIITGVTFKLKQKGEPEISYRELEKRLEGVSEVTLSKIRDVIIDIRGAKGLLVREGFEKFKSAGSFFKNPVVPENTYKMAAAIVQKSGGCANWAWPLDSGEVKLSAACLIQSAGFVRGYRKGNVGISPKHTLIVVNYGGASAGEVVDFCGLVRKKVMDEFGISLVPEVRLIGFPPRTLEG